MKWILFLVLIAGIVFFLFRRSSPGTAVSKAGRRASTKGRKAGSGAESTQRLNKSFSGSEIRSGADACQAALALAGKRFLASEVPKLPLEKCDRQYCKCTYVHHDDRRDDDSDRRLPNSLSTQLYDHDGGERRRKRRGRRKTD